MFSYCTEYCGGAKCSFSIELFPALFPSSVPRKKHKKQRTDRGCSPVQMRDKWGEEVKPMLGHTATPGPALALLTLLRLLSLGWDPPLTSEGHHDTSSLTVPLSLEAFEAANDLLSLPVPQPQRDTSRPWSPGSGRNRVRLVPSRHWVPRYHSGVSPTWFQRPNPQHATGPWNHGTILRRKRLPLHPDC